MLWYGDMIIENVNPQFLKNKININYNTSDNYSKVMYEFESKDPWRHEEWILEGSVEIIGKKDSNGHYIDEENPKIIIEGKRNGFKVFSDEEGKKKREEYENQEMIISFQYKDLQEALASVQLPDIGKW